MWCCCHILVLLPHFSGRYTGDDCGECAAGYTRMDPTARACIAQWIDGHSVFDTPPPGTQLLSKVALSLVATACAVAAAAAAAVGAWRGWRRVRARRLMRAAAAAAGHKHLEQEVGCALACTLLQTSVQRRKMHTACVHRSLQHQACR